MQSPIDHESLSAWCHVGCLVKFLTFESLWSLMPSRLSWKWTGTLFVFSTNHIIFISWVGWPYCTPIDIHIRPILPLQSSPQNKVRSTLNWEVKVFDIYVTVVWTQNNYFHVKKNNHVYCKLFFPSPPYWNKYKFLRGGGDIHMMNILKLTCTSLCKISSSVVLGVVLV